MYDNKYKYNGFTDRIFYISHIIYTSNQCYGFILTDKNKKMPSYVTEKNNQINFDKFYVARC